MAEGIKPFSWASATAKIMEGWSDSPYFKTPILSPAVTIVDGVPAEVKAKLHAMTPSQGTVIDTWNQRR